MELDYETTHWGARPSLVTEMTWPSREPGSSLGEVRSIAYVTRKDEHAVFEHTFEFHDGWRTNLLRLGSGPLQSWPAGKRLVALGRVVDIRMASGRIIRPAMLWIATIPRTRRNGGPVILASRHSVPVALEHRVIAGNLYPFITPHGIEG